MPTAASSLTVRKILPCRPEVAFEAWTKPAVFRKWFAPMPGMKVTAKFDLRRGGKYRIGFKPEDKPMMYVGGKFVVIDPPHRIEYTWVWEEKSNPDWKGCVSLVTVLFNAIESERTEIVLTHERFADPDECKSHTKGWTKILNRMAAALRGK